MYSLIVLGLIPGTQIQITFYMWVIAATVLLAVLTSLYVARKHIIGYVLMAWRIRWTIRHQQLA
jgi:hypothetical protein